MTNVYDIAEYGAVGDGSVLCTEAIQRAIDECASAGGGEVVVPAGVYLTGPIFLRSRIHLRVMAGATLLASADLSHYPGIEGRWEGVERTIYASLITGCDLENVSITGQGTLDGQGPVWWQAHRETQRMRKEMGIRAREAEHPPQAPLRWPRPRVIYLHRCRNVTIDGLTLRQSPSWTVHPVYCENVTIHNVSIMQPYDSPNTDGIDPDSCKHVRISNCHIDCGDDCIVIKSGYNEDGSRVGIPCENIAIANCTFAHGRAGVVVGSEMSGDVRNIVISNCVFDGTLRGLRVKAARGRGGIVENIRASNLVMRDIGDAAISITLHYGGRASDPKPERPPAADAGTPRFRDIHISDVMVTDAVHAATVKGLPEMPIEELGISNLVVRSASTGVVCSWLSGAVFHGMSIHADEGPAVTVCDAKDVEIHRLRVRRPDPATPQIHLERVVGGWIQGCTAAQDKGALLRLCGEESGSIALTGNRPAKGAVNVIYSQGATPAAVETEETPAE